MKQSLSYNPSPLSFNKSRIYGNDPGRGSHRCDCCPFPLLLSLSRTRRRCARAANPKCWQMNQTCNVSTASCLWMPRSQWFHPHWLGISVNSLSIYSTLAGAKVAAARSPSSEESSKSWKGGWVAYNKHVSPSPATPKPLPLSLWLNVRSVHGCLLNKLWNSVDLARLKYSPNKTFFPCTLSFCIR